MEIYNPQTKTLQGVSPTEVDHLREVLPTLKWGGARICRDGEYQIGYDQEAREAALFKLGKQVEQPKPIDLFLYRIFEDRLKTLREGAGTNNSSRFKLS